jgi:hypothetical protein
MSTRDMPANDVRAEIPPAEYLHPEFGYFCPSVRLRRKLRRTVASVLVGTLIAAGAALAVVSQFVTQTPVDGVHEQAAMVAAGSLPADIPSGASAESMPAMMAPAIAVTNSAAPSAAPWLARNACDEPSGAFLMPQCRPARTGKSLMTRAARAARRQVATLPIGDADAEPEAAQQQSPAAETALAAAAMDGTPPLPPERPAAPAKKPVKIAHKRAPSPAIASTDLAAAGPRSPGFDLFSLFHDPSRPGTGAWAMSR